jgi:hypothetical protein
VVCEWKYHDGSETEQMFINAGIKLEYVNNEILQYDNQ